jgi:hypothetical protein
MFKNWRSGLTLLPIFFGLVLIGYAIISGPIYLIGTSLYATEGPLQPITGTLTLRTVYPAQLRLPVVGEMARRPLTMWLMDKGAPHVATGPYTVTLSAVSLSFQNEKGVEIRPQLTLVSDSRISTPGTIYLEPQPYIADLPSTVTIEVGVELPDGTELVLPQPLLVHIESRSEVAGRLLRSAVVLVLGSAVVVIGWGYDRAKRSEDQKEKCDAKEEQNRRNLVDSIGKLAASDPLMALPEYIKAERRARAENWDATLLNNLHSYRPAFENQQEIILYKLNQICGTPRQTEVPNLLNSIAEFYGGELAAHLQTIRPVLMAQPVSNPVNGEQALQAACWLWDAYDERIRTLVITVFVWASQQHMQELDRQAETAFGSIGSLRRLSSDPRLKDWGCVNQFASYEYRWPPLIKGEATDTPTVADFLRRAGFTCNPFGSGQIKSDSLLFATYVPPRDWPTIIGLQPALVFGHPALDCAIVRLLICHEVEGETTPYVFPILCELTEEFGESPQPRVQYVRHIAHQCARTWLAFLPHNPNAWFALLPDKKRSLADMLAWHNASPINLLQQHNLPNDAQARRFIQEMQDILASVPASAEPDEDVLLMWLAVRPAGLQYTYLLMDCPFESTAKIQTAASHLPALIDKLRESNVVLKFFAAAQTRISSVVDIEQVIIVWENEHLDQMLNIRVARAGQLSSYIFADLFEPEPRAGQATDLMVAAAQGSLGRLLRLGRKVTDAHAAANADKWMFDIFEHTIHDAL